MAVNPKELEVKKTKEFDEQTILDLAKYISGMIVTEGTQGYNCLKAAKGFADETGKNVETAQKWAQRVFPSSKIKEGVTPDTLVQTFIANDRLIQNARKVQRAVELLKANPSTPYTVLSKEVGMPYMTLKTALERAGVGKLDAAERGLRVVTGRDKGTGKYLGEKQEYRAYYSESTLTAFELVLAEEGGDLERARKKFETTHSADKVDRFMKLIFPAYLVEKLGAKGCIDQYRAWLATKPKSLSAKDPVKFAAQQEVDKRMKELIRENEEKPQVVAAIKDTMAFIRSQVFKDSEIGHRALFLNVSRSVLLGISGQNIAKRYNLDEKAVIGVRRRMIDYLYSSGIGSYKDRQTRLALLRKTGFYKTFDHDTWLSESNINHARFSERQFETPRGLRIEHLDRDVQTHFEKRFRKPINKPHIK